MKRLAQSRCFTQKGTLADGRHRLRHADVHPGLALFYGGLVRKTCFRCSYG
jgi:hypothetical protein